MTDLNFTQALLDRYPGYAVSIAHRYPLIPKSVSMPLADFVRGYSEAGLNKPNSNRWMPAIELLGNTDDCVGLPVIATLATGVQAELAEAIERSVLDMQAWAIKNDHELLLNRLLRMNWRQWLTTFKAVGFEELCGNNDTVKIQEILQLRSFIEGLVSSEFTLKRVAAVRGLLPATALYEAIGGLFQFENSISSVKIWLESHDQRRISLAAKGLGNCFQNLEQSFENLGLQPKLSLIQLVEQSIERIRANMPKPI